MFVAIRLLVLGSSRLLGVLSGLVAFPLGPSDGSEDSPLASRLAVPLVYVLSPSLSLTWPLAPSSVDWWY